MADLSKLQFYSKANYLKKDSELSGELTVNMSGTSGETKPYSIAHNLGYIPFCTVMCQQTDASTEWMNNIWPDSNAIGQPRPVDFSDTVDFRWYVDESNLYIILSQKDDQVINTYATGPRTVRWNIYRDYGDLNG